MNWLKMVALIFLRLVFLASWVRRTFRSLVEILRLFKNQKARSMSNCNEQSKRYCFLVDLQSSSSVFRKASFFLFFINFFLMQTWKPYITGKLLLMLQSVKRAHAIDASHPKLHEHLVKLAVKGEWEAHQHWLHGLFANLSGQEGIQAWKGNLSAPNFYKCLNGQYTILWVS